MSGLSVVGMRLLLVVSRRPHNVIIMGGILALLLVFAFDDTPRTDSENAIRGLKMLCAVFLITCVVHFRDGPFYRPHPAIWRLVHGLSVLYELFLVYLLFQVSEHVCDIQTATTEFLLGIALFHPTEFIHRNY